jgi:hypothetical protein
MQVSCLYKRANAVELKDEVVRKSIFGIVAKSVFALRANMSF